MQLRRGHPVGHFLLLLALLLPLVIQPRASNAQNSEPEPNFMVVEYAKLHNLSYEEAERRLQLQIEMSALEGRIIEGEATYAGSWTQHEPEFRLIVAFTVPNGQEIIQKYLAGIPWADLVEVRQAKYTVAELTVILEQVNQAAQTTTVPFESGTNIQASKVTLYTPHPDELRRQLETQDVIKQYMADIEFVYQEHLSVPQDGSDEQDPGVESYAKLIGISLEEAARRLKLQIEMDGLEGKVLEGEPSYAGSWTVHEPEFGLVIAFAAEDGAEKLKPYLEGIEWANLVKVQQSPYTDEELVQILEKVTNAAKDTGVRFESGADPRTAKVNIYSPEPDKLRADLEAQNKIPDYMDDISFIFQEFLSSPNELKYPYLPGGIALSQCTAGFAVRKNSDNRRFMMTAGHCPDTMEITYNGANNIFAGPVVWHTPINDFSFGDLQVHDVSARSLDVTNGIFINPGTTVRVSAIEVKATTLNDYVCKYGKITAYTCGYVGSINYNPESGLPFFGNYVRVDSPSGVTTPIACIGDSGGPWFKPALTNEVIALGIHYGSNTGSCANTATPTASYTPVDVINSHGFTILTSSYPQRYHQNVYFTNGTCSEYVQPYNDDGVPLAGNSPVPCSTSLPGSGTVETYTAWVAGQFWREAVWRGGLGYTRKVPLNANGTINWGNAQSWSQCCGPQTAPRSQDRYVVGNHLYQSVYWTESNCLEYKRAMDSNGEEIGTQTSQTCRTTLPAGSSGTITSYTAYVVGGRLREGIWRGGVGYVRDVPLTADKTDVNWSSAPAWSCCLTGLSTTGQGGDVLSYP